MLRLFSEKETKLNTKSVSVVEASGAFWGLLHLLLFLVALDAFVAVVLNVEIEPVKSRLSWIFTIVSARVVAPDMSISTFVSRKIKSVSKVRMFAISLTIVTMTKTTTKNLLKTVLKTMLQKRSTR